MKFEYSPADPDDWPDVITVTATEVEEGCGVEEGDIRLYEQNWKHRIAGKTIREQREKLNAYGEVIDELRGEVLRLYECLREHNRAHIAPSDHALSCCRSRIGKLGIEVPDEMER